MKTKNFLISALSAFLIVLLVLFMFSFTHTENIQYKAVVALDKIHFIYLNFENPVTVIVPGVPKEKVVVKCAEVPVKSLGNSKYSIPVMEPVFSNRKVHLSVYILNTDGKEQFVETIDYLVISAPEPLPYFAGRSGGIISFDELKSADSIYIEIPGFYYEGFRYKVSKFIMVYMNAEGFSTVYPQESGFILTSLQKTTLMNPKKGDKIIFNEIFATYTDPITKKTGNEIRIPKSMEFSVE
jgi:hypothetical protein